MSRARSFCFTLNNYDLDDYERITNHLSDHARYGIVGEEIGANGTPHLQGYVSYPNARSFNVVKADLGSRVHLERANGSAQDNRTYCSKDGLFFETGIIPDRAGGSSFEEKIALNKRLIDSSIPLSQLIDTGELSVYHVATVKRARMVIDQEYPPEGSDDVRGVWYWGPPGVGKSRLVREICGEELYLKAQNKWWDGYTGESNVLLDDLDTDVLGHYMKIWADRYACTGEIKGGTINLRHKKFYVTSNYSPEQLFKDPIMCSAVRRRFDIIHMVSL